MGELVLAAAVAGVPAARLLTYEHNESTREKSQGSHRPIEKTLDGQKKIFIVAEEINPWFSRRYEAISFLNFPGMAGAILFDRFTTWPMDWAPKWSLPLGMWGWRSLSWPLFSLPFWWLGGRGIDSFFASLSVNSKPSIRWFEAWGMGIFGVCVMILGSGLAFMSNSEDDFPEMRWVVAPCTMWFIFGAISFLAWWRQRRAVRMQRSETIAIVE